MAGLQSQHILLGRAMFGSARWTRVIDKDAVILCKSTGNSRLEARGYHTRARVKARHERGRADSFTGRPKSQDS